jgi:ribose/xylose/arabinose/galactoside ABC-type transport system permease subunit
MWVFAAITLLCCMGFTSAPAAFIGVAFDLFNGIDQWKEGHVVVATLYFSSAAIGAVLAVIITLNVLTSLILPLTLLLIAIGLLIMWLKERELKEFLVRSYFGTNKKKDHYTSIAEERKAYNGLGA